MYRVLIADDESIIREGIKCLFDWESLGYTIAGEAANGETAYQQILALQPHGCPVFHSWITLISARQTKSIGHIRSSTQHGIHDGTYGRGIRHFAHSFPIIYRSWTLSLAQYLT